jgi:hypothetical protein
VCLFLFSSFNSFAWELDQKVVYLPLDLASIKGVATSSKGVKFTIKYKKFHKPVQILPIDHKQTSTFKKYIEKLIYVYKSKNIKELIKIVDKNSESMITSKPLKQQQDLMSLYAQAINPVVHNVFKYHSGFIITWSAENFQQPMQVYVIKENENFKMSKFHASKDDEIFWNSNNFLKYYPFKKYNPKLLSQFSKINKNEIKELNFKLVKEKTYLNLFKKDSQIVSLVAIDNYDSKNYKFKDYDSKLGLIKLKLGGRNFIKKGEHKIYYIESNYPLGKVTPGLIQQSKSFNIIKE